MGCPCSEVAPKTGGLLDDLKTSLEDRVRREALLPMGFAFAGGFAIGALVGALVVHYAKK